MAFNRARKAFLLSVGLAAIAQERAERLYDRALTRGEEATREGRSLVEDIMDRAKNRMGAGSGDAVQSSEVYRLEQRLRELELEVATLRREGGAPVSPHVVIPPDYEG